MRRFASLTTGFLLLIGLIMLAEYLFIRVRYPRLWDRSPTHWVSVGDLALSASGELVVSRVTFGGGKTNGSTRDVIWFDPDVQDVVRLNIENYRPQYVAVSPVSDDLAVTCEDQSIRVLSAWSDRARPHSACNRRVRLFASSVDCVERPTFSPDGRLLAAISRRFIHVWRWPSGDLLVKRPRKESVYAYLSFSSDSQQILSPGEEGEVCLWDACTGREFTALSLDEGYELKAVLSPDARPRCRYG